MALANSLLDGAALFYTTPLPANLQVLRQYALHMLFMPPAPSPAVAAGSEVQAPVRNLFPFTHKSNTLDRDRIVVPAGWDSWGKIGVLRDGFDAKVWGEAWERDLEAENEHSSAETGAKKAYANLVPDQGSKVSSCTFRLPIGANINLSLLHYRHSITLHRSKHSLQRIMTRRSPTEILVVPSGIRKTLWAAARQVLSVPWGAAVSACRTSNVPSPRWRQASAALRSISAPRPEQLPGAPRPPLPDLPGCQYWAHRRHRRTSPPRGRLCRLRLEALCPVQPRVGHRSMMFCRTSSRAC
jgi:hypothetical protein